MIKTLVPLEKLQNSLIEIIDHSYQNITTTTAAKSKPQQTNNPMSPNMRSTQDHKHSCADYGHDDGQLSLKRLYLTSSSIAEIFPDHILVNVINYLQSKQYKSLPVL